VFQGLLLFALLASDTLINYRIRRLVPAARVRVNDHPAPPLVAEPEKTEGSA
jgi:hypothetical protein